MAQEETIQWQTVEHEEKAHSREWFWAVGIITLAISVASFLLGNPLFGILILIAGFSLILVSRQGRQEVRVELSRRGVRVGNELYPYGSLKSFAIDDIHENHYLVLHSSRLVMPHIKIPVSREADLASIRTYLAQFLTEEDHEPSVIDAVVHFLGF